MLFAHVIGRPNMNFSKELDMWLAKALNMRIERLIRRKVRSAYFLRGLSYYSGKCIVQTMTQAVCCKTQSCKDYFRIIGVHIYGVLGSLDIDIEYCRCYFTGCLTSR